MGARLAALEARLARSEARTATLEAELARKDGFIVYQQEQIDKPKAALDDARRSGKRQAAPFSKGEPKTDPARPGRKRGEAHGRHGHRRAPLGPPDRELTAGLPGCCPDCGGAVVHERDATQWTVEVPELRATITKITVEVGRCSGCRRRLQGSQPEQISQALGAAEVSLGPRLKAWAAWLHYGLGLSFARSARVIGYLGVPVTAGAICQSSARSASTELAPVHADLVRAANRSATVTMDESGVRHEVARIEWLHRSEGLLMVV